MTGTCVGDASASAATLPPAPTIFDGFLLTSTNGDEPLPIVDVPMIQMPTQTEVVTRAERGIAYRRPDSDAPGNRFRLYEVAGMPHNNSRESLAFANDPCTLPVTDFPAGAFTALARNHLIEWITGRPFILAIVDRAIPAAGIWPLVRGTSRLTIRRRTRSHGA